MNDRPPNGRVPHTQFNSLGGPKVGSFGSTLRKAIKSDFGSAKAFAKVLGVSEGRVSQIASGQDDINPETLARVLNALHSVESQERVHAAWISECAPLPRFDDQRLAPEAILSEVQRLWQNGFPARGLALAKGQRQLTSDSTLWYELTSLIAKVALTLEKKAEATTVLREMEVQARKDNERTHLLTALYLKGCVLRNSDRITADQIDAVRKPALELAYGHDPDHKDEVWRQHKADLDRDFALHVLALYEFRNLPSGALPEAKKAVQRSIDATDFSSTRYLGLEVRARLEVALHEPFAAEETIESMDGVDHTDLADLAEKLDILRARIAIERGEREEAVALLSSVAEACFARMNFHHFRVADRLLARIVSERACF